MYPELTDAQVRAVADALRQAITTG